MRPALAWKAWSRTQEAGAREALLRHYAHIGDPDRVAGALTIYTGKPGQFPAFVRRANEPLAPVQVEIAGPPAPVAVAQMDRNPWQRALGAVLRAACKTSIRDDFNVITLRVEPGALTLYGRCWTHAVSVAIPAGTNGNVTFSMPRAELRVKAWGIAGRLECFPDEVIFTPVEGAPVCSSAQPATMPDLNEPDALAGVIVARADLLHVLDQVPDEVELRVQRDRLRVDGVELPALYGTGAGLLLLDKKLLSEAVRIADGDEVTLEVLTTEGRPARISSENSVVQVAQRLREPVL